MTPAKLQEEYAAWKKEYDLLEAKLNLAEERIVELESQLATAVGAMKRAHMEGERGDTDPDHILESVQSILRLSWELLDPTPTQSEPSDQDQATTTHSGVSGRQTYSSNFPS